jgi:hypothetical protein
MPYDKSKADAYNKLIQSGVSEADAEQQAGIDPSDFSYSIGDNGLMGPLIVGSGLRQNE